MALQSASTWLGLVGLFVAPTTLITAVCYFFGYAYTLEYFAYFGISSDAIGFTTTDYVIRSINIIMFPVFVLLIGSGLLLIVAAYARSLARAGRRIRLIRVVGWTAVAIGTVGFVRGIVGTVFPRLAPDHSIALTPVALGVGAVLVVFGLRMLAMAAPRSTPRRFAALDKGGIVIAGTMLVLGLMWGTSLFATARAETNAKFMVAELWADEASVVIDTSERMVVPPLLIKESSVLSRDPALRPTYRYECFRALAVRGDRWVLLPASWTPQFGYVVIVTASDSKSISTERLKGIADTAVADWEGSWRCPEVAPSWAQR